MKSVLIVAGVGVAAYFVLGLIKNQQFANAVAACGGPNAVTLASGSGGCPTLNAVNAEWAWYPTIYIPVVAG